MVLNLLYYMFKLFCRFNFLEGDIFLNDFTETQKLCIDYFKENLSEWLKDGLKIYKYAVIGDNSIKGIYDTIDGAVDFAYDNLELGSYIIQQIIDENEIISYLRLAVVE